MCKVSICIPAYRHIFFLKRAIESIYIQKYKDYEVIITDDSGDDKIKDFLNSLNPTYPNIRYYQNKASLGSPRNWNEGLKHAKGEYIKIVHHDDWFTTEDSLGEFVRMMEHNPDCDFAFSATRNIHADLTENIHVPESEFLHNLRANPEIVYLGNRIGAPSATIYRNKKGLFFDPELKWLVDVEFYIRVLSENNNYVYNNKPLISVSQSADTVTASVINDKHVNIFEYFYVFDKITKLPKLTFRNTYGKLSLKLIAVCREFNVSSIKEIRDCGFSGHIPYFIKKWLLMKYIKQVIKTRIF